MQFAFAARGGKFREDLFWLALVVFAHRGYVVSQRLPGCFLSVLMSMCTADAPPPLTLSQAASAITVSTLYTTPPT